MAAERPLEASTVSMGLASMGTNHSTNGYQTRLVLKITILLRDQTQPSDQMSNDLSSLYFAGKLGQLDHYQMGLELGVRKG